MDISGVKIVEPMITRSGTQNGDSSQAQKNTKDNQQTADGLKGNKELSKEELQKVNSELNKFMSLINSDIQFSLHERTKQLMVQVIDTRDQKVIKEFPSHEMLDIMANIREYVGVLLDRRA